MFEKLVYANSKTIKLKSVLFVFGTRPEAIKLAPVINKFKQGGLFKVLCCSTGQHKEMLDQVVHFFNIHLDYELHLMQHNQTLSEITARLIESLSKVYTGAKPDLVVVHGDTTTSFCAALTAFYHQIPAAHIEAGLRTGDKRAPFPEEMNRTFNGYLCSLHFAPTQMASDNLKLERITQNVHITGNTIVDAVHSGLKQLAEGSFTPSWSKELNPTKKKILVTQHRRENFGDRMDQVFRALKQIADRGDVQIVFPVHLNPKVKEAVLALLSNHPAILLLDPLPYPDLLWMMQHCDLIITDSGGIQEEAPSLGKPFLVTRDVTERPEAIRQGNGFLIGADLDLLVKRTSELLDDQQFYLAAAKAGNPYGDGHASERIHDAVRNFLYGN